MSQPTANEQELLELINRMRSNPAAELALLLNSTDETVVEGLNYYNVDRVALQAQWNQLIAAAPLAWASSLKDSAAKHNQAMIAGKQQAHVLPGELNIPTRMAQAGYQSTYYGENIYAASESVAYTHTGLAIDWGTGANTIGGIQTPALHRVNLMSQYVREVGISAIEDDSIQPFGPMVVTEDFGNRAALTGKGWLLGVAFEDKNQNGGYQAGEGLNDVSVKITGIEGTNFSDTITVGAAGGYQELLNPGRYQVDFSRNGQLVASRITAIDSVAPNNVKLDLVIPVANFNPPTTPIAPIANKIDVVVSINSAQNPNNVKVAVVSASITPAEPIAPVAPTANIVLPVVNLGSNLQTSTEGKVLDFRTDNTTGAPVDLTNKSIAINFTGVTADAAYHNYAGLYRVEDVAGTVIDPTNDKSYRPGESAYLAAALRRAQVDREGTQLDKNGLASEVKLKGGYIYAPFIVANGRIEDVINSKNPSTAPHVYFNYKAANTDNTEHIKMLGANKFGFEDLAGGGDRDYNDLMFQVNARTI